MEKKWWARVIPKVSKNYLVIKQTFDPLSQKIFFPLKTFTDSENSVKAQTFDPLGEAFKLVT